MTSSLVGSEMCIRDREEAALGNSATVVKSGEVNGNDNNYNNITPKDPKTCLLYTSDAADDM
eukprot:1432216-Prorocentrum_lima.AAC.1